MFVFTIATTSAMLDLEKLREISLKFTIDPIDTIGHAAKLEDVINVLKDINDSYKAFLEIEFHKNEVFQLAAKNNDTALKTIIKELDLYVVELDYSSFSAALAPNLISSPILFSDNVMDWKTEKFNEFKEDIITADFNETQYLTRITERYSKKERLKIFKPLFSSMKKDATYKVNILSNKNKIVKTLIKPKTSVIDYYLPKLDKISKPSNIKTINTVIKIKTDEDGNFSLNKANLKEILFSQELEHDTYPFQPLNLDFENKKFALNKKLDCIVSFEDDTYFLENKELNILVFGDSRKEAEEAFSFSFNALYENFYSELDSNLSDKAIMLKAKLNNLIKDIYEA